MFMFALTSLSAVLFDVKKAMHHTSHMPCQHAIYPPPPKKKNDRSYQRYHRMIIFLYALITTSRKLYWTKLDRLKKIYGLYTHFDSTFYCGLQVTSGAWSISWSGRGSNACTFSARTSSRTSYRSSRHGLIAWEPYPLSRLVESQRRSCPKCTPAILLATQFTIDTNRITDVHCFILLSHADDRLGFKGNISDSSLLSPAKNWYFGIHITSEILPV